MSDARRSGNSRLVLGSTWPPKPKMGGTSLAEKIAKAITAHAQNQRIDSYVWELLSPEARARTITEVETMLKSDEGWTEARKVIGSYQKILDMAGLLPHPDSLDGDLGKALGTVPGVVNEANR